MTAPPVPTAQHHTVQVYDDPGVLARCVGAYLATALQHGEAALVVATPAHRDAVADDLVRRGHDVARLRAQGRLVELDADEALGLLMPGGELDGTAFEVHVAARLAGLRDRFGGVSAYGEMVARLWGRGLAPTAVALEHLWNDLGTRVPFRLYCGYDSAGFDRAGTPDDVSAVFAAHSDVLCA